MADWITTNEAAELTGYSVTYLRGLIRLGKVFAEKKGNTWWVDREALLVYLKAAEKLGSKDKRHGPKPGKHA